MIEYIVSSLLIIFLLKKQFELPVFFNIKVQSAVTAYLNILNRVEQCRHSMFKSFVGKHRSDCF